MTKKVIIFFQEQGCNLSVAAPGDTNPSDVTGRRHGTLSLTQSINRHGDGDKGGLDP